MTLTRVAGGAAVVWSVLGAVPLAQQVVNGPGPIERRARPVATGNPVPRRTFEVMPAERAERMVVRLRITVDRNGAVAEARPLEPATSVLVYQSTPSGGDVWSIAPVIDCCVVAQGQIDRQRAALVEASLQAVRRWRYALPSDAPMAFDVAIGFVDRASEPRVISHGATVPTTEDVCWKTHGSAEASLPRRREPTAQPAVRTGGDVGEPATLNEVPPCYPPIAQSARISGDVTMEARVEADGEVSAVRVESTASTLLTEAATKALWQWRFVPTIVGGMPVPVLVTRTLRFTLH